MKNKYIWLILGVFLLPNISYAQVAGYLGKRLSVGLEGRSILTLYSPPTNVLRQNFTKGITASYVLTNKYTIGVSYLNTTLSWIDNERVGFVQEDAISQIRYYGNYKAGYSSTTPLLFTSNTLEISIKKFNGEIAPLGTYWGMRLALNTSYAKNKEIELSLNGPNNFPTSANVPGKVILPAEYNQQSILLGLDFGKTRVVMDRFLLDFGILCGLNITLVRESSDSYYKPKNSDETLSNFYQSMATRVSRHNYILFKGSVSYLIY